MSNRNVEIGYRKQRIPFRNVSNEINSNDSNENTLTYVIAFYLHLELNVGYHGNCKRDPWCKSIHIVSIRNAV